MTVKAIETIYAGCRFRSRLEARWAVFFDTLGIRWQYEAQGYELGHRITVGDDDDPAAEQPIRYLPDFWLPDLEIHAEVKGSLTDAGLSDLLDAIAHLSTNGGCGRHDAGGHDTVVLGHIPRPDYMTAPVALCMNKGILTASPWRGGGGCLLGASRSYPTTTALTHYMDDASATLALDGVGNIHDAMNGWGTTKDARDLILGGMPVESVSAAWTRALDTARRARFEHGETPTGRKRA